MRAGKYRDRRHAGRVLAGLLGRYRDDQRVVVVALPRGGVPVGYEVAAALRAPLDVFVVRKLGVPGIPELAMGAIGSGGVTHLNHDVMRQSGATSADVDLAAEREGRELARREAAYRGDRRPLDVSGKVVLLIDDGLATGATMTVAVQGLRTLQPSRIVVGVPVAAEESCRALRLVADDVVCAKTPASFGAVGGAYRNFDQTPDEEVCALLATPTARGVPRLDGSLDQVAAVRHGAVPIAGVAVPDDELFDLVGDARLVLMGEASHGTHEFYAARAHMTRRLIQEKGFRAVAVEADWPDAYRVNRYVNGRGADATADQALGGFQRFPQWMWRNVVVERFVEWLRAHNAEAARPTGFYGIDLYSMYRSADEVITYLDGVNPEAAQRARQRYECFDRVTDEQRYGYQSIRAGRSCEDAVVTQLRELCELELDRVRSGGMTDVDERFYAEQNALLVKDAEEYYRAMFAGHVRAWNLRDLHMMRSLEELAGHLDREVAEPARIVVWAHNSHLGDARATELGQRGELNVGELARQRYDGQAITIGFTTYTGSVTAADHWGGEARRMLIRPGLPGSVEALLHLADRGDFLLRSAALPWDELLERAIGVIYRPATERQSHYFRARLRHQFDAVVHFDTTTALQPLEAEPQPSSEPAQTYPSGV